MNLNVNILKRNYSDSLLYNNDFQINLNIHDIKVFNDEEVIFDKNLSKIIKIIPKNRKNIILTGILVLKTKYKYGYNKRNMPYYIFIPFNNKYPKFLVASNIGRKSKKNHYAIISYNEWINTVPRGNCERIIGEVNDYNSCLNYIIFKNNLKNKKVKLPKIYKHYNKKTTIYDIFSKDELSFYNDIKNLKIFSIDPPNCKDIDDALSIIENDDNYRIGIHIADSLHFIKKFNFENNIVNYSTIYAPHKKINMLPDILSDHLCSLHQQKDRLSLTLWIYINKEDFCIENYNYEYCLINSNKAYSYDEAQNDLDNNKELKMLYDLSQKIYEKLYDKKIELDMHKMIEIYMILANNLTGKYLSDDKNVIYRIHESTNDKYDFNKIPDKLTNFLRIFQSKSAIYTNKNDKYYHFGLDLERYTHFTSPIRRYVDNYIHCLVRNKILDDKYILNKEDMCDVINKTNKSIKVMERDFRKIQIVNEIYENGKMCLKASIIEISEEYMNFYIKELNLCDSIPIVCKSLNNAEHLSNIKYINDNSLEINGVNYNKYDEIEIELYAFPQKMFLNDKIKYKLL